MRISRVPSSLAAAFIGFIVSILSLCDYGPFSSSLFNSPQPSALLPLKSKRPTSRLVRRDHNLRRRDRGLLGRANRGCLQPTSLELWSPRRFPPPPRPAPKERKGTAGSPLQASLLVRVAATRSAFLSVSVRSVSRSPLKVSSCRGLVSPSPYSVLSRVCFQSVSAWLRWT
jgi:hypothetical protein